MTVITSSIGAATSRWVRGVLRFRKLVIGVSLLAAVLAVYYSSSRLGINTDTANMISDELPWRQDFIEFRASFPARDRTIAVVVTASTAARADAFTGALVNRLEARSELFRAVFAAGADAFFERNGLLYLGVDELEELADRLAAAQPLLGLLRPAFDGAAVLDAAGRVLDEGGSDAAADALLGELAGAIDAAAAGERSPVEWRRLMLGGGDGAAERRIVVLRPELDFERVQPAAPAIAALREIIAELNAQQFADVDARVTGSVAMEHEEMLSVQSGAGLAALASLVMVALVLYAALRSLKLIVIALTTLVVGLAGTAAFAAAAVGHLNLLSVAFAVLYVGLGVDFIFHMSLRLKELLAEGLPIDDAIVQTAGGVGTSLVICAVTTAAGFYAFIPTDFEGVSELGLISGTGMFVSLAVSFTLLPALLGLMLTDTDRRVKASWLPAGRFAPLASRPKRVIGIAAVLGVIAVVLVPGARFDSNPIHLRDPSSESVQALEALADDGEAPLYDMVALAPDRSTAESWAEKLAALPEVRSVTTLDALVPERQDEKQYILDDIALLMGPGFAELERAPFDAQRLVNALAELERTLAESDGAGSESDDAESDGAESDGAGSESDDAESDGAGAEAASLRAAIERLRARLASSSGTPELLAGLDADITAGLPFELARLELALSAVPFDLDALPGPLVERWVAPDGRPLVEIAPTENVNDNDAARRFVTAVRSVVPTATGLPVVYQEASRTVVGAFQSALAIALVLVTLLLFVFLRKVKDVLLVIVPIVLACAVTAAATVVLDIPFNFANIITLPLLVGIGVDNGIHIVHRMRSEPPADGGPFRTSTSLAVLASGLTTVASFGNLSFSAHRGMASMGQMLTLGMIVMLTATLVLLPALLKAGQSR